MKKSIPMLHLAISGLLFIMGIALLAAPIFAPTSIYKYATTLNDTEYYAISALMIATGFSGIYRLMLKGQKTRIKPGTIRK